MVCVGSDGVARFVDLVAAAGRAAAAGFVSDDHGGNWSGGEARDGRSRGRGGADAGGGFLLRAFCIASAGCGAARGARISRRGGERGGGVSAISVAARVVGRGGYGRYDG